MTLGHVTAVSVPPAYWKGQGHKKAHSGHKYRTSVFLSAWRKRESWQSCVWRPGVWQSVPTHRHRYLTWAEPSASSTATANTLATHPAVPQKRCLAPEDVEFYSHHLHLASHHPLAGSQLLKHSKTLDRSSHSSGAPLSSGAILCSTAFTITADGTSNLTFTTLSRALPTYSWKL